MLLMLTPMESQRPSHHEHVRNNHSTRHCQVPKYHCPLASVKLNLRMRLLAGANIVGRLSEVLHSSRSLSHKHICASFNVVRTPRRKCSRGPEIAEASSSHRNPRNSCKIFSPVLDDGACPHSSKPARLARAENLARGLCEALASARPLSLIRYTRRKGHRGPFSLGTLRRNECHLTFLGDSASSWIARACVSACRLGYNNVLILLLEYMFHEMRAMSTEDYSLSVSST